MAQCLGRAEHDLAKTDTPCDPCNLVVNLCGYTGHSTCNESLHSSELFCRSLSHAQA
jgi:hypothetical protein